MPETHYYHGSLTARVYRPPEDLTYHVAVLQLHGGGWRGGQPADLAGRCAALSALGFTCIAIEYSLAGARPWPAPLQDIAAAIDWTRRSCGELGTDPAAIALQGYSAGGHLALMYALAVAAGGVPAGRPAADGPAWPGIAAVLAHYPPVMLHPGVRAYRVTDLAAPVDLGALIETGLPGLPAWMLLGGADDPQAAAAVSPLGLVRAGLAHAGLAHAGLARAGLARAGLARARMPPVLLVHGGADLVVPAADTLALASELQRAGVETELHLHAGQVHEFDAAPPYLQLVAAQAALFLRRCVAGDTDLEHQQLAANPLARLQGLPRPRPPGQGGDSAAHDHQTGDVIS